MADPNSRIVVGRDPLDDQFDQIMRKESFTKQNKLVDDPNSRIVVDCDLSIAISNEKCEL